MKGRTYYFNKSLGISQYESPLEESPPLPPPLPRMGSATKEKASGGTSSFTIAIPSSPIPSSSNAPLNKRKATVFDEYDMQQLLRERRRLRAMVLLVEGKHKAEITGEIAAIDSDLHTYFGVE